MLSGVSHIKLAYRQFGISVCPRTLISSRVRGDETERTHWSLSRRHGGQHDDPSTRVFWDVRQQGLGDQNGAPDIDVHLWRAERFRLDQDAPTLRQRRTMKS